MVVITVVHSLRFWLPQTQTWIYNQVHHLPDRVENHVVCEASENLDQFWLPNIHSLSEMPRWRYHWDKGLRRLRLRRHSGFLVEQARRHRAQVLHSHFGHQGWRDSKAAEQAGTKHVVTFYGQDLSYRPRQDPRWRERYSALFERIDCVLCEGPHMARSVIGLGCPEDKVSVHHLGVRVDEIAFKPREWKRSEPLRVLIASSFQEKKGIPYALEALGRLQHEMDLEITIVGDATGKARSQAEKQKILATIERHGLERKVRMRGFQPHAVMLDEAYGHHLFLSPSVTASDGDTEGGAPVSIIEMAATGMPVVSTTHCDIPEVVHHGLTGLLADERDVDSLVDNIRWLLDNPDRWYDMSLSGREHVEAEFDAGTQGERLMDVYGEILNDSS